MTTAITDGLANTTSNPDSVPVPAKSRFSPGLLVLAFLLNALIAMAFALCFRQLDTVSMYTVLVLLFCSAMALLVWASYQILLMALCHTFSGDDQEEPLDLVTLVCREWKLLRFKSPMTDGLSPQQRFVCVLPFFLLIAGAFSISSINWGGSSSVDTATIDLVLAIVSCAIVAWLLTTERHDLPLLREKVNGVIHSPKASRIRWALLTAANLVTCAYGLHVILPFATATGCPFAIAFLVFSVAPFWMLAFCLAMLLLPTLAVFEAIIAPTNSN